MSIQEKNNAINQVAKRTKALFHQKQLSPNQKMKYLATWMKMEIIKMVSGIADCEEKYLLKLRKEQDIINTCFSMN